MNAAKTWLDRIKRLAKGEISLEDCANDLRSALLTYEHPKLINTLFERHCHWQCKHCLLPPHEETSKISQDNQLGEVLDKLIGDMERHYFQTNPQIRPAFLHEGRILQPWHIPLLRQLQDSHPNVRFGLIDTGDFMRDCPKEDIRKLKFDWLDLSMDEIYTSSRENIRADAGEFRVWDAAAYYRASLMPIPRSAQNNGRVSALMTLNLLNYNQILEVAEYVFHPCRISHCNSDEHAVDEFHITTMNPKQQMNYSIDLDVEEIGVAFEAIKRVQKEYGPSFFRLYNTMHLGLLAQYVSKEEMVRSLEEAVQDDSSYPTGVVKFNIQGMDVYYYPTSIWPSEGIFIDVDGSQRVAFAQQYTLEELERPELSKFTVQKLTPSSSLDDAHRLNVETWHTHFMKEYLKEESRVFRAFV